MNKKSVDIEKNTNRSELIGKVEIKESPKKKSVKKEKVNVDLEQTMALDTVELLKKGNVKKHTEEEKRSEIAGKVSRKKKVKDTNEVESKKSIEKEVDVISKEEKEEDKVQENVETVSLAMIAMMVLFSVVVCFVVGYMLYKIALTNSDTVALIFRNFGI